MPEDDPESENLSEKLEKLENQLKSERSARKAAEEEMEREVRDAEKEWMERVRKAGDDRETMAARIGELEDKLEQMELHLHRTSAYKSEVEEANQRLRLQYESLQRDYEETMQERSVVLEENSAQNEQHEKLQKEFAEELTNLKKKLENARRLVEVNNASRDEALGRLADVEKERDEALLRCMQTTAEAIVDVWNTHSVQISLPFPKPNLGLSLGGGKTDDGSMVHGPIYVRGVAHGSPFEHLLRKLDHIMMVNDISVTDMDERSVTGMLSNSHHIHLVIRRRSSANRINDVCLVPGYGVGLELSNGVFINSCEASGAAYRSGLAPGQRVVHVNNVPVYDAKHAETLIKTAREPLIIGILQSSKNKHRDGASQSGKDKREKPTIFTRWFHRNGTEKERTVVAKANIEQDKVLLRQGSLRMPQTSPSSVSPLIRYGSLRAPNYPPNNVIIDQLEKRFSGKSSTHSEISSSTTPWSTQTEKDLVFAGTNIEGVPVYVPKNTIFSTPTSPVTRLIRHSDQKRTMSQTSESRPYSIHFTPTTTILEGKPHQSHQSHHQRRSIVYSPLAIRDNSLSSVLSSSNSIRLPSTSYSNQYGGNNSTCSLTRATAMSKDGSDFSISTTYSNQHHPHKKYHLSRGSHHSESLLVNRSTQPRMVEVARSEVKLCGGNAIGILAEKPVGTDLLEGDLILSIDGNCVRNTTLECAQNTLHADTIELTSLVVQDGGDRLNRLRLGADGDSFFLRVNGNIESKDKEELDLKSGDVVFVDKTVWKGRKWRAWKVDKEGRQREHGAIPSNPRKAYEWVEKLDQKLKRPVLLFGALVEPFLEMLVDESDKFSKVARESLTASHQEVSALLHDRVLIDSKQNDAIFELYHVVSTAHIMDITAQGVHCVLQVDQSAIDRLKKCRMHPIIVRIRFKSTKQLKDVSEHICGEKIGSKEAKILLEKDVKLEKELEGAQTMIVPSHNNVNFMMTHAVLQLKKIIEDEQKKIVWVPRKAEQE